MFLRVSDEHTDEAYYEKNQEHLNNAKMALRTAMKPEITEADTVWLRDQMEEMAGTRDLEEANRRMDVVWEWRLED